LRQGLGEITDKHIDDLLSINVKGVILTVQKALPPLAPGASVILNASIVASKGFAEWSDHSATKAAVRSFARTWSADLKGRDIRINAVSPGVIDAPGYRLVGLDETRLASLFAQTASIAPIGRNGVPSDVAKVVSFLACDDSGFITGSEIFVDGEIAQIRSLQSNPSCARRARTALCSSGPAHGSQRTTRMDRCRRHDGVEVKPERTCSA
jgi:NAD(P)-dependent dehydrogenase (short-subunit alcohol dehydrogenase family)